MVHAVSKQGPMSRSRDYDRDEQREIIAENENRHSQKARSNKEYAVIDENLQYRKYGGFHLGTAFYGWLVSTGIAAILVAILGAAGSTIALTNLNNTADVGSITSNTTNTVGLISALLLVLVLAIAYYAGGYVAGRMARYDGARQGFGVWTIGLAVMILLAVAGAVFGVRYNILQQLNLPNIPVDKSSFSRGGLLTTLVAIVASLGAAVVGGKAGEMFHRRVDAKGTVGHSVS